MTRMLLAAVALTLLMPVAPLAHPGHDHKLLGTISSVDGHQFAMKTSEGKDVSVTVTETTAFKRGKVKGALSELKAGLRVVVNVGDGSEPLKAKEVQYAAPTTSF